MGALAAYRLPVLRLLWAAVWVEFLVVRLLSRVGIFIPKSGTALAVYRAALTIGEVSFTFSLLLAVTLLLLTLPGAGRQPALGVAAVGAAVLFAPGSPPPIGWSMAVAVALLGAVAALGGLTALRARDAWERWTLLAVLSVHLTIYGVAALQLGWVGFGMAGQAPLAGLLLRYGELPALAVPLGLAALGLRAGARRAPDAAALGAGLAATVALGAGYWLNPDLTAILAMYSLGFSLSWPPALYLTALAAGTWGLVRLIHTRPAFGLALGLLFLAGYSLQTNQQHLLVLAGWSLLALPREAPRSEVVRL